MEHKSLTDLARVAKVHDDGPAPVLSAAERLERWAEALERQGSRRLNTLHGTEFVPAMARDQMRADNSPISVAFADPVLRAAGLNDDTYGAAKQFFSLSDRQIHDILCYCHHYTSLSASRAAELVRATRPGLGNGVFSRMRAHFGF